MSSIRIRNCCEHIHLLYHVIIVWITDYHSTYVLINKILLVQSIIIWYSASCIYEVLTWNSLKYFPNHYAIHWQKNKIIICRVVRERNLAILGWRKIIFAFQIWHYCIWSCESFHKDSVERNFLLWNTCTTQHSSIEYRKSPIRKCSY